MPGIFKINPPVALENSAAMAIHDEFLYFIEIDENNEVTRKITIPLADGCIVNGQIKNFALLESAFVALRRETGKIHEPVSIGIPEDGLDGLHYSGLFRHRNCVVNVIVVILRRHCN